MRFTVVCVECERKFNLLNELDATEWSAGHDCEAK
jgi:hypothetical protein